MKQEAIGGLWAGTCHVITEIFKDYSVRRVGRQRPEDMRDLSGERRTGGLVLQLVWRKEGALSRILKKRMGLNRHQDIETECQFEECHRVCKAHAGNEEASGILWGPGAGSDVGPPPGPCHVSTLSCVACSPPTAPTPWHANLDGQHHSCLSNTPSSSSKDGRERCEM